MMRAVEYERIPPHMRGRVFGTITAGAWAAMPLSVLVAGFLTEQFGTQPIFIGIGIIYLLTTLSMALMPGHARDGSPPGGLKPIFLLTAALCRRLWLKNAIIFTI